MTKSWWHGRAILAQGCPATSNMMYFLLGFGLLLGAVSHVPCSLCGLADEHHPGPSGLLRAASGTMAGLHRHRRGPEGRHAPSCCTTSAGSIGSPGTSPTGRWNSTLSSTGLPCGFGLQLGQAHPAHEGWRQLGVMDGAFTIWRAFPGHPGGDEGYNLLIKHGEEDEDDSDFGSGGRRRLPSVRGRSQRDVVSEVHLSGRRLPPRRRKPNLGAAFSIAPKAVDSGHRPVCGHGDICAVRAEGNESQQVQDVRTHFDRVRDERNPRTCHFPSVAHLFSSVADGTTDVGRHWTRCSPRVRDDGGAPGKDLSFGLALDLRSRRGGKVFTLKQNSSSSRHEHQGGEGPPRRLRPEQALGLRLPRPLKRRSVLAIPGPHACFGLDCLRKPWNPSDTRRAVGIKFSASHRTGHGLRARHEGQPGERSQKTKAVEDEERWRRWRRRKANKRHRGRKERKRKGCQRPEMFRMEQWECTLRRSIAWAAMLGKGEAAPSLHEVRLSGSPKSQLPEEGLRQHGGDEGGTGKSETKQETAKAEDSPHSYTYTYESEEGEEQEEKGEGSGNEEEEPVPLQAETLEEYYTKRVFIFIHHFAGLQDPLSAAMRNEALRQGIRLKAYSVEKDAGTGDLTEDEPYATHIRWARRGYVDAYHAGFPCSTFSRLRWRKAENLPGPVRSRDQPYGLRSNSAAQQAECDRGTIMAARAIDMATEVSRRPHVTKVPPISTLENPPPSDVEGHCSAWDLSEMDNFRDTMPYKEVQFNTCAYEDDIPVGRRHFKPQMFAGSLHGIAGLSRKCNCGSAQHEPIVGADKSKASATYPASLCREYAKLAVTHLKLMGKEEFLKSRMTSLQDTIDAAKAQIYYRGGSLWPSSGGETQVCSSPEEAEEGTFPITLERQGHQLPIAEPAREYKAATEHEQTRSPARVRGRDRTPLPRRRKRAVTPDTPRNPALSEFVGGMRDPFKVMTGRSTALSLGIRLRAAWEAFERKHPKASQIAETYTGLRTANSTQLWFRSGSRP